MTNLLEERQKQGNDFIQELFERNLCHILQEIYSHLTLTAVEVFKRVSREWKNIICQFDTSKVPRLRLMEDQKISNAWKNEKPFTIVKSSSKFPFSGSDCTLLFDEMHIVLYDINLKQNPVFILSAKILKFLIGLSYPKETK